MATRTAFLSKLIGLYALIFGICMLVNRDGTIAAVAGFARDPALVLVCGVFALGVGLAMILGHNRWSGGVLPIVVTVIGWLSLIKGVVLLFVSPAAFATYMQSLHYEQAFYIYAAVTLLVGAYLTYGGFSLGRRVA